MAMPELGLAEEIEFRNDRIHPRMRRTTERKTDVAGPISTQKRRMSVRLSLKVSCLITNPIFGMETSPTIHLEN